MSGSTRKFREGRLDELREEARARGTVDAPGHVVAGGPIPPAADAGYYGRPIVKPPVWTWEVPLYFFVGGAAGMSAALALAALVTGEGLRLPRTAMLIATVGAALSGLLLILDLGRPARFLNMLRVFKWRSPMSVGAWTLAAFGALSTLASLLLFVREAPLSWPPSPADVGLAAVVAAAAASGLLLATYTGVLLAATAIPVWSSHRRALPAHFAVAALGSAVALLELSGFRLRSLAILGLTAALIELGLAAKRWTRRKVGVVDAALFEGQAGRLLTAAGLLMGPSALALRLLGWVPAAALAFLAGALASRYGWVAAGRASALEPRATVAMQVSDDGAARAPRASAASPP